MTKWGQWRQEIECIVIERERRKRGRNKLSEGRVTLYDLKSILKVTTVEPKSIVGHVISGNKAAHVGVGRGRGHG